MKIVIISNSTWNIYNFRSELIKHFIEKKYTIYVYAPIDNYYLNLKKIGCNVINIKMNKNNINIFSDMIYLFKILNLYKKIEPDYVLSFTIKPNIFSLLCCYFYKTKVIVNISGLGTTFLKSKLLKIFTLFLYKISISKAHHIFFQNSHDKNIFEKYKIVNKNKSSVLPGSGIDISKYNIKLFSKKKHLKKSFLYIGRLIVDKGLNEYFKSAEILMNKYDNIEFLVLGHYDTNNPRKINEKQLKQLQNKKIIKYIGHVENVIPYIIESDCIVLPSYREGLSRSLLEGAALAKPLVASNVPGCSELIINNINGYLCEPKNYMSLTKNLEKIIKLDHEILIKMGKESRKLVEKKYNVIEIINAYEKKIT